MLEVRNEIELHSMQELIEFVRNQLECNQYIQCEKKITEAMARYPNAPEPHNLFGIYLERKGMHSLAMRHFRVSLDLLPTYRPASQNLRLFGELFCSKRMCAYCEADCIELDSDEVKAHVERIF